MTRRFLTLSAALTLVVISGCSTKKFVRTEAGDVNEKVDSLSQSVEETQERTRQNEGRIKEVDDRAQSAAAAAKTAADSANSAAMAADSAVAAITAAGLRTGALERAASRLVLEVVLSEDQGNFSFARPELPDQSKSRLDELAEQLKDAGEGIFLEIEGHTDNAGSSDTNARLGLQRAEAVKRYLYEQHQIPLHKMSVISFGEEKPVSSNATRSGRALNRRVVVKALAPPDSARSASPSQPIVSTDRVTWNVWTESAISKRPDFKPVPALKNNSTYKVVVELSSLIYGESAAGRTGLSTPTADAGASGIGGVRVSPQLGASLARWADEHDSLDLDLLLVPHGAFFARPSGARWSQTVTVDLRRVRTAAHEGVRHPPDAMSRLRANPDQAFSFGRAVFVVKTKAVDGMAPLALSVWKDGRPLDDYVVRFCVADEQGDDACSGAPDSGIDHSLSGVDSLSVSSEGGSMPTAALHLIDFEGDDKIRAVFKRNDGGASDYVAWTLEHTGAGLARYLRETLLTALASPAIDEAGLHQLGSDLFHVLFPTTGNEELEARREFRRFLKDYANADRKPSLFVRLIERPNDPMLLVPIGLAFVDGEFIGFRARVETPLTIQSYKAPAACVSDWTTLLPLEAGEATLNSAMETLDSKGQRAWWLRTRPQSRIEQFAEWLSADVAEPRSTALVTLSHHDANALFFRTPGPKATSEAIVRQFGSSSVAILNGCGTGGPGADLMVRALNRQGFTSVIATNTSVTGTMAGHFLSCLSESLGASDQGGLSMADAYSAAIDCLRERSELSGGTPYGARALKYSLLGNGGVKVCAPPAEVARR